ncbi:HAD family hydrolase [Paenibacillus sacheonensis]|uniref:HAD-IA family hydrolase n=1 Tax=Paenibacillus sacheonensis TaxID=742054 RepID=A0A7X4YST1_9BACL|nr:HAD family hydrolase [Paenibacillus sacheonensis]MBM7567115.1 putative hydrolase of the HAD superfamily [Paenibacillus sacheonensis]NBC70956.1 HAD-IA family hydrolase [Paenibacillus sacheonensis]
MRQADKRQAIFFDVDDTLYDHLIPFRKAVEQVAGPLGSLEGFPFEKAYHRLRYHSDMLSLALGGAGAMEEGAATEAMRVRRFRLTLAEFGFALSDAEAEAMQAAYIGCQYDITLFEGARALLEELVRQGWIVGLITNGAPAHQRSKIEAMQLDELIPRERQLISGALGWDKPDRRVFQYANELTDTEPANSVYVGDSWRNDVIGAAEAGWTVIWFNHRGAERESEHEPAYVVESFAELRNLFLH